MRPSAFCWPRVLILAGLQGAEIAAKLSSFEPLPEPTMGGEDFSFIAEQVRV